MKICAAQSRLNGRVAIPGSKSHTIRCVAMASLARGTSRIASPLSSSDTASVVSVYRCLGARIDCQDGQWIIEGFAGAPRVPDDILDVGNSGTTLRFCLGSAALLADGAAVLTGDAQVRSRPVGPLVDSLNDLGARCFTTRCGDAPPVVVRGQLSGGRTSIAAITSQYLSSLLFHAPLASGDTEIDVTVLNEAPYVAITMDYLDRQGIAYQHDRMRHFTIPGGQHYTAFERRVPGDFSSATFFLCAGAIGSGQLVLEGLDMSDLQGDKAVIDILRRMGASITIESSGDIVVTGGALHGIEMDLNATPDALPALAVAACFADSPTRIVNVPQARLKETDRIAVMAEELSKLGADISETPDGLEIRPRLAARFQT